MLDKIIDKTVFMVYNIRKGSYYRFYWKEVIMDSLNEVLNRLVSGMKDIFGDNIFKIILYGSTARGTASDGSDIDIAVMTGGYTDEMHDQMIDLTVDLELEYDKVLSVVLIDYDHFREWENTLPFYLNVKKDGVILWSAA